MLTGQASAGPSGGDFLLVEPTARAAALGGAFSAQHGRLESLRYNPAGLKALKGLNASLAHVSAPGDWSHEWAGVSSQLGPAVLGAELLISSLKAFELYDADGQVIDMAGAGSQNLMLAASIPLPWRWLSLGAGLRYFRSQLYTFESTGLSGDFGLLLQKRSWPLSAGLALQNLGSQSAYFAQSDPLPLCLRSGVAARLTLDKGLDLSPRVDLVYFEDQTRPLEFRAGLEADIFERVGLRAGLLRAGSYQQLSFGAGLNWDGWGLDYAFQPANELGSTHLIELHVSSSR